MFDKCPGATPIIKIKKCPECGEDVELLSTDIEVKCDKCGFTVYNDLHVYNGANYAKECVGEELYKKLKKKRILFLCVENSCRSQIVEALAKKLCGSSKFEFVSGGTQPSREVDQKAIEILKEENIIWRGRPKMISDKEPIDIVVTLGCEVACPTIPGAKIINWDIPDPKGKGIEDYRRTLKIIKEKVAELLREV